MTALRFKLPTPLVLNANAREHWAAKARKTRDLRQLAALKARTLPTMDRAHLLVHVGWPDKRRRDADNIRPTLKALIDGIVDAGVLPDDSDAHLIGPDCRTHIAGVRGFLILDFELTELAEGEVA